MKLTMKITAWFVTLVMVLTLIPHTVFALGANNDIEVSIKNIVKPDNEIYQGDNTRVTFDFEINKNTIGEGFKLDEKIEVDTNIGQLFDANWSKLANIEIKDVNHNVLATMSITENKMTFVIKEGAVDSDRFTGQVISTEKLVAKNVGATEDNPVKKELQIGNATKSITFKARNLGPIAPSERGPVDIDTSWKNAWSISEKTGATTSIEVNPIGSMDLYGYYTYPKDQKPNRGQQITSYDNFLVKDVIQDKGYIDKESVKIYAAVPYVAVRNKDVKFNGWYNTPAGTYYAGRQGTIRYRIDKNTPEDFGRERLKYLTQNPNETYEQFYSRVAKEPLQWGIYYSFETDTETFLCNFGGIGHNDSAKNNGIKYSDYGIDQDRGAMLGDENFLADKGPTAGNIVSYYIEFNSYYPEVEGVKNVKNAVECYNVKPSGSNKISGNEATFEINNGGGFGNIRKNELNLQLVDEEDKTPISNAKFKLQQKDGDKWVDTQIEKATDSQGMIRVKNIPNGTYKIVQLSTADGYLFDNNTYEASTNPVLQTVSQNGEFTISDDNKFGVGTIVTNAKKKYYNVEYKFESKNGETLPKEVTNLKPTDDKKYNEGETINSILPTSTSVTVSDGIWQFVSYDVDSYVANTDNADANKYITFTGTWEFKKNALVINQIPVINGSDKTIYVGDEFDPLKAVTATDKEDGDITASIEVLENNVDTSVEGTYKVTYKVTDSMKASSIKTINVTVVAKEEPPVVPEDPDTNDSVDKDDQTNLSGPTDENNKDKQDKPENKSPETGDDTNMGLLAILLFVSAAGALKVCGKKEKQTKY